MAKQAVSGIERHVDKIVFVVAVAVFLAGVGKYLLKSPRTVDVGIKGPKGPGQVDASILEEAGRLDQQIQSAKHDPPAIPNPVERLVAQFRNPLGSFRPTLNPGLPWRQPTVPKVVGSGGPSKVELATVVAPDHLAVAKGRSTIRPFEPVGLDQTPKESRDLEEDRIWVAVAAEFDLAKQLASFKANLYLSMRSDVQFIRVLLQRRSLQGDGTWGNWEPVQTYSPFLPPELPDIQLVEEEGVPTIPDEDVAALNAFSELISKNQVRITQPLPPTKLMGDEWMPPPLDNVKVADALARVRENVAGPGSTPTEKEKIQPLPVENVRDVRSAMKQLDDLSKDGEHEEAIRLANHYLQIVERANDRSIRRYARQLQSFIRDEEEAKEKAGEEPAAETRAETRVPLWAFDSTVVSGTVYQYRMAVEIQNRYAGVPDLLANPADAEKIALAGEWSAPSLPVRAPETTRFFLVRAGSDQANVEVWRWKLGQWRAERFTVAVGDMIGEPKKTKDIEVDFSTGAMVVGIDENRPLRYVSVEDPRAGTSPPEVIESAVLVYRGAGGELGERVERIDTRDDWRKQRQRESRPGRRTR